MKKKYRPAFIFLSLMWTVVYLGGLMGCSKGRGHNWLENLRPKTAQYWLDMALDSEQPDDRRRGVNGLAESADATSEWAMKAYDTIARTDMDAMVRCAALRALQQSAGDKQVETTLKLINGDHERYQDIRPAPAAVRWWASRLLLTIVHNYAFRSDQKEEIITTLIERLSREQDSNTKLTLVETLGYFPDRRAVTALIAAMEDRDFAMQHAAELALVSLTGVTYDHDPDAWRAWLNQTDALFEHAGELPNATQARRGKPRWDWLQWWE